jgi:uncharacterized protein (UPF0335 family)
MQELLKHYKLETITQYYNMIVDFIQTGFDTKARNLIISLDEKERKQLLEDIYTTYESGLTIKEVSFVSQYCKPSLN